MKFTKEFTDAVEQKNRLRVRIMLKDAFLLDKTGDTFDKMEQYAAERMPELYEAHDEEILLNQPEQWTIDYFNDQMVKVVGNFSRERVALLKKMAAALFGEKAETAAPTERTETSATATTRPPSTRTTGTSTSSARTSRSPTRRSTSPTGRRRFCSTARRCRTCSCKYRV